MGENFERRNFSLTDKQAIRAEYDRLYGGGFKEGGSLELIQKIPEVVKGGKALDIGAGMGRNSFELARHGLSVTALELSESGGEHIRQVAKERGLPITVQVDDVSRTPISGEYDVVVSTFALHHLSDAEARSVLEQMREHTKVGGVNAVILITNQGGHISDRELSAGFYPDPGYLQETYKGWEILERRLSSEGAYARDDGSRGTFNLNESILARKL